MMMRKFVCYTLALLLAPCFGAAPRPRAQDEGGNPANWCRNGAFTDDAGEFGLARVAGAKGERAYFYGDEEGCPGPEAKCRQKAYVVAGDELVVSRRLGDWVCSWYQPARGHETVGWLPARLLALSPADPNPPRSAWLGAWSFYSNTLQLARGAKPGALRVEGEAFWHGANPENIHTGDVAGEAAPSGNVLKLEAEDCRVTLRLVGAYLVVDDNNECGGANVSFDGVYRRRR